MNFLPEGDAVQGQSWEGCRQGVPSSESLFQVPTCLCAPGSFGEGFDGLMAPGMGLEAAGAEHYLGSAILSVLLRGCADELLSQNLTSAVGIHCVCKWICKKNIS